MTDPDAPGVTGEEPLHPLTPNRSSGSSSILLRLAIVAIVMFAAVAAVFENGDEVMEERPPAAVESTTTTTGSIDESLPELQVAFEQGEDDADNASGRPAGLPRGTGKGKGDGDDEPRDPPARKEPTVRRTVPTATVREPAQEPSPDLAPWSTSTRITDAGYVATDVGCAADTSAAALDTFFADRIGPIIGHDYQHVYPLGDERFLWVFQDTFLDHPGVASRFDQSRFAHNTALLQEGTCFTVLHRGTAAEPASFEQGTGESSLSHWFWPMGGEVADGRLSVFWVQMINTDEPLGPQDGLGWYPASTWLATYDADTLARLDFRPAPNSGTHPIYGYAVSSDDEYSYLFGNSFDQNLYRQGGYANGPHSATAMWLARVPRGQLGAAPEYRTATGWSDAAADASPITRRFWAENPMQPRYLGGQWVAATKVDGYWGNELAIDVANQPWGPWTTVSRTAAPPRDGDPLMLTYHAYLMPWLDDGSLVVSFSQNARLMLRDAWPFPFRYRLRFENAALVQPPPDPATTTTTTEPPTTTTTESPTTTTTDRPPADPPSTTTTEPPTTTTTTPPNPEPGPPVAGDDRELTPHGQSIDVPVLDTDVAAAGAKLVRSSVVFDGGARQISVRGGEFEVDGGGVVSFTPAAGFVGASSAVYRVSDDNGRTATATVTVDVADPPVAVPDAWEGQQGAMLQDNDPLENDRRSTGTGSDLVRGSVAFRLDRQPSGSTRSANGKRLVVPDQGEYTIGSDGLVTFDPDDAFHGLADDVWYVVADEDFVMAFSTISVTVTTSAAPDAVDDVAGTAFDTDKEIEVLLNDTPLGAALTVRFPVEGQPEGAEVNGEATSVSVPDEGVYTLDGGLVTFSPDFGRMGLARPVRYQVTDVNGTSDTAHVRVEVSPPPFGTDDRDDTSIATPVDVAVLLNDVPPDGAAPDPATVVFPDEGQPAGAVVAANGKSMAVEGVGEYGIDGDGVVTFVPSSADPVTAEPVWYSVRDSNGVLGAARLTVDVRA